MDLQHAALTICVAAAAYIHHKRCQDFTISDVPGPKNPSWIFGHAWWWQNEEAGIVEKRLLENSGAVARWNGSLGEQRLWVADPKAVQHILHSCHLYEKPSISKGMIMVLLGKFISVLEGDEHKRKRRALSPAFGAETKALYPHFIRCSNALVDKWHGLISVEESGQTAIIDVHSWLNKAALDAIGAAGFDYDFGALENSDNKLVKSYASLKLGAFSQPSKGRLFMMDAMRFAPKGSIIWLMEKGKHPVVVSFRENRVCVGEVAAKIVEDKRQELKLESGVPQKDILSLLAKANSTSGPDQLSDEDLVAQVRGFVIAGHESTAKTLTFALWELAKNRQVQEMLRAEIMDTLGRIRARGDDDFAVDDFDSMPYLLAVGKEVLRVHPVAAELPRIATKDNMLPLAKPIVGVSGKVYNEIPVPAGTVTAFSIIGYNMNKAIWGPDAYEFRPERWLDMGQKHESPFGVYSNLCRNLLRRPKELPRMEIYVIEMHAFLVTLIRQFDFSLPGNGHEAKRMRHLGVLSPIVVGEEHKGPQMPLKVTALRNE